MIAAEQKVKVVLASGRSVSAASEFKLKLSTVGPIIVYIVSM